MDRAGALSDPELVLALERNSESSSHKKYLNHYTLAVVIKMSFMSLE